MRLVLELIDLLLALTQNSFQPSKNTKSSTRLQRPSSMTARLIAWLPLTNSLAKTSAVTQFTDKPADEVLRKSSPAGLLAKHQASQSLGQAMSQAKILTTDLCVSGNKYRQRPEAALKEPKEWMLPRLTFKMRSPQPEHNPDAHDWRPRSPV